MAAAMTDNALAAAPPADTPPPGRISAEADRRRTFAVISHPDAGKSTLTEALALHARAITEAGAVHGKAGRRSTVSDWMDMEKARGISITSTALQFPYVRHQPARHSRSRRLLRRHLPRAYGRRLRGDAHRRRERS
jgi:peptide chain release factor 3